MSDNNGDVQALSPETLQRLVLVGINHRGLDADLRARYFDEEPDQAVLLESLRRADCAEGMVVATCERLEFAVLARPGQSVAADLMRLIADFARIEPTALAGKSYCFTGQEALRHLFAVTASLDSVVVGEPQILGQVKLCYRSAVSGGLSGPVIDAAMQAAFGAAKRIRSETPIGQQAGSMTLVATQVAEDLHGRFDVLTLLWLGLGEMGEMLCSDFRVAGVERLLVMHGSTARAEATARRLACNFAPLHDLDRHLAEADIVVSDASSGRFSLDAEQIEAALRQRRRRPMLVIDAGVPSDVEPSAAGLEGAFVYDLDDLERLAKTQSGGRAAADAMAWAVLEEELERFCRAQAARTATPSLVALRNHFEAVRKAVLDGGADNAEEATRLLVNKLLHDPSEVLRKTAADDPKSGEDMEASLRKLFALRPEGGKAETKKNEDET